MRDFAAAYGGFPDPAMPWNLFYAGALNAGQYEARRLFGVMQGTAWGAATAFKSSGALREAGDRMRRLAYPDG